MDNTERKFTEEAVGEDINIVTEYNALMRDFRSFYSECRSAGFSESEAWSFTSRLFDKVLDKWG